MSETKKRKFHLPEFKAKVGLEALQGGKTINEIGQEYGIHPVQVSQWRKEIQEQAKPCLAPSAAHSEPDRLYGEIGRLKMELDWLKKSQGSACHDASNLDQKKRCAWRVTCHDVRMAQAKSFRRRRSSSQAADRRAIYLPPFLQQPKNGDVPGPLRTLRQPQKGAAPDAH